MHRYFVGTEAEIAYYWLALEDTPIQIEYGKDGLR
jgi:hypothetical protein